MSIDNWTVIDILFNVCVRTTVKVQFRCKGYGSIRALAMVASPTSVTVAK